MEKWELFQVLANPFRLQAVEALARRDLTAGALAERGGVSPSAASNALRTLMEAGLVDARREGRHVVYGLRHPELARFLKRADAVAALAGASRPRRRPRRR